MTNESVSYKTLRASCLAPRDRLDRVENMLMTGMPDTSMTLGGVDVWMEIKTPTIEPVRPDTALLGGQNHNLSIDQRNWLLKHARAGGRGFVYIDAPSRRYLISGRDADLVNGSTPTQLMLLAKWTAPVPTTKDRWSELRSVLRGV